MTVAKWVPSKLYAPGALCVPRNAQAGSDPAIPNADFELGDQDWTKISDPGATTEIVNEPGYDGAWCVKHVGTGEDADGAVVNDAYYDVIPGQKITSKCFGKITTGGGGASYSASVYWYDESNVFIAASSGTMVTKGSGTGWRPASVTATAPAGAYKARIGATMNSSSGATTTIYIDTFSWNYVSPVPVGLMYKAVQPAIGYSDGDEPDWPTTVGVTIVDNEVIWECVAITRVTWEASPIMLSGPVEPEWSDIVGEFVLDNTVSWEVISRRVEDENCPHSKYVTIAKSKIFAGDRDIIAYSATLNALDWTSEKDAGFLAFGLAEGGDNDITMLNLYRGNLIAMNSAAFQQWQIDPDPELMSQLDDMQGIGSVWHLAAVPIANDLFYLSNLGVRTIGISGATNNLKAGDVGLPVDTLIQEAVRQLRLDPDEQPLGFFFPSSGQYWLVFNLFNPDTDVRRATVWVYTLNQTGQVGAWSHYEYPFAIDYAAMKGDDLYVRDGDNVFRLSDEIGTCDYYEDLEGTYGVPFDAVIQFPWLDMGQVGADKDLESFNVVGEGRASIEIGYSQTDPGYFTAPYLTPADTLPGTPIPMPLCAPSFSVRLTYHGWDPQDSSTDQNRFWQFIAVGLEFAQ